MKQYYIKNLGTLFIAWAMFWLVVVPASGQDQTAIRYAKVITQEALSKHLHVIAADSMEGRDTGSKGQKKAADYIRQHFKTVGLAAPVPTPEGNSYFQRFQIGRKKSTEGTLTLNGQDFVYGKDFFSPSDYQTPATVLQPVFVGYGIHTAQYSDYEALEQLNGQWVICYQGEPLDANANSRITGAAQESEAARWETKLTTAQSRGAKGLIIIAGDNDQDLGAAYSQYKAQQRKRPSNLYNPYPQSPAVLVVSASVAAQWLNTTADQLKTQRKKIGQSGKTTAETFTAQQATLSLQQLWEIERDTENVLGFLEGTDKKDELLVISAHYDHVGMEGDKIFNGADDDGSGTVAVMMMAEAFAKAAAEGYRPRRSILFITVAGEEIGLFGSQFYTDVNPIFPLENTVANLNIDMIGRIGGEYIRKNDPNYIYLIGSDKLSTELHQLSEKANDTYTQLKLDYLYNRDNDPNRFYYRSDHYNFAKNRIPVIFYFNGVHPDYHQHTDTVEKIHFPKMEKITRLIFHTAWEIANREERLKVDK
jgi:hypothetical protein